MNNANTPNAVEATKNSLSRKVFLGCGCAAIGAVVAVLFILACIGILSILSNGGGEEGGTGYRAKSVSDYRAEVIKEVNEELAKPDSALRKRVEDAHVTVTVKSTRIVRCDVTTIDGTDNAGEDDSNISQVVLLIRFNWEGWIDTGYTDLRIVIDVQNERVLESKIDHTTALVNIEDSDFWFNVGVGIGALFL